MSEASDRARARVLRQARRRPITAPVILAGLLAWLLCFLAITLQPGYRGGSFVIVVLAATALALAFVLVSEIAERRHGGPGGARTVSSKPLVAIDAPPDAAKLGRALWFSILLIVSVVVFGVYFGTPLALFWICRRHCRSRWGFAAAFALVVGAALPYLFARVVSIELWAGAIPEIIPGWLGGGLLPPV